MVFQVRVFRLLWNAFGELYAESRAQPKIGGRDSRGYDREPTFPTKRYRPIPESPEVTKAVEDAKEIIKRLHLNKGEVEK
jgi:hypothetical protein